MCVCVCMYVCVYIFFFFFFFLNCVKEPGWRFLLYNCRDTHLVVASRQTAILSIAIVHRVSGL